MDNTNSYVLSSVMEMKIEVIEQNYECMQKDTGPDLHWE